MMLKNLLETQHNTFLVVRDNLNVRSGIDTENESKTRNVNEKLDKKRKHDRGGLEQLVTMTIERCRDSLPDNVTLDHRSRPIRTSIAVSSPLTRKHRHGSCQFPCSSVYYEGLSLSLSLNFYSLHPAK